jgi:hypothetical protein
MQSASNVVRNLQDAMREAIVRDILVFITPIVLRRPVRIAYAVPATNTSRDKMLDGSMNGGSMAFLMLSRIHADRRQASSMSLHTQVHRSQMMMETP